MVMSFSQPHPLGGGKKAKEMDEPKGVVEAGLRQVDAQLLHFILFYLAYTSLNLDFGQIIATSHDLGPQMVVEEGNSPYFKGSACW